MRRVPGPVSADSPVADLANRIAALESAIEALTRVIQVSGANLVVKGNMQTLIEAGGKVNIRSTGKMSIRAAIVQLNPPA